MGGVIGVKNDARKELLIEKAKRKTETVSYVNAFINSSVQTCIYLLNK